MITPTVIEIPRTLNAVSRDTFIDGAGASATRSRRLLPPATASMRSIAPAQAQMPGRAAHAVLAAQRGATSPRATTFVRAA